MMRSLHILIAVGWLAAAFSVVQAQTPAYLVVDRDYYTLGDQMEVALLSTASAIAPGALVELVLNDPSGEVVDQKFVSTQVGGAIQGSVTVPFGTEPGYYTLRVFGLGQGEEKSAVLAKVELPVYDDLNKETWPDNTSGVIRGEATIRPLRKEVQPVLPTGVRDRGTLSESQEPSVLIVKDAALSPAAANTVYRGSIPSPLDTMMWIEGTWQQSSGAGVASNLIAVLRTLETSIEFAKSDANGTFLHRLRPFYGNQALQFVEQRASDREVRRASFDIPANPSPLPYWEGLHMALKASAERKAIYAAYGRTNFVEVDRQEQAPTKIVSGDVPIAIDDYSPFPDFGTFAYEVFGTASRWRPTRKGYYVRVYDRRRKEYFQLEPLVLLNGFVAQDIDSLSTLNPSGLDSVHIYGNPVVLRATFPALGQNGVIRLVGKTGFDVSPFVDPQSIVELTGLDSQSKQAGVRKPELPWLSPTITFRIGERSFVHTDDRGSFSIQRFRVGKGGQLELEEASYQVN